MNPLTLLKAAPWLLCLLLAVAVGVQTMRLAGSQERHAEEKLAYANFREDLAAKSLKVVQDAAAKSAEQVGKLTTAVNDAAALGTQTRTEVHYVQSNGGPCVADPKWRATVGGVQRGLDGVRPGGDKGQAGSGAPPAVR